jgi:hypothetical protein
MGWTASPAVRHARSRHAYLALAAELEAWFGERTTRTADELRRQGHQLGVIAAMLRRSLERIGHELEAVPLDDTAFARCSALDVQLGVIERYWRFYRERLEQRDDPARRRLLAAADEIVWSCFTSLGGVEPASVPLPYVEPTSSPIATPRTAVPPGLRTSDKVLADLLGRLPIPLIAFPTGLAGSPWWLALLAHEVGHHIQYDLEPNQALVGKTGDALAAAAQEATGRWTPWRFELFADACSVVAIGTAAIHAIAELEWGPLAAMSQDRAAYPPAIVRLATMCAFAGELGLSPPELGVERWRAELAAAGPVRPQLDDDLARVPAVAQALADLAVGGHPLRARLDAEAFGDAGLGAIRARLGGAALHIKHSRRAARLVAAAAFELHRQVPADGEPALAESMLALVEATCDGQVRAAPDPAGVLEHCVEIFDRRLSDLQPDGDA